MLASVVTLDQALALGFSRRRVYRLVELGQWLRLHEGIFLTDPAVDGDRRWKADLLGRVLRGGSGSMVSHRSAARLHNLDGVSGWPIEVTVRAGSTLRGTGIYRSQVPELRPHHIDGLPVTSVLRTIVDLARDGEVAMVEQALESALRGRDAFRPDVWNVDLLRELRDFAAAYPRRPGNFRLKAVLGLRSEMDRPTGSFPETVLFQALRALGLVVVRQATVRIFNSDGRLLDTFYPDLCLPEFGLLIEVDSLLAHSSQSALARDLQRQNKLVRGFRVRRFTALELMKAPERAAEEIRQAVLRSTVIGPSWRTDEVYVSYSPNEFRVVVR